MYVPNHNAATTAARLPTQSIRDPKQSMAPSSSSSFSQKIRTDLPRPFLLFPREAPPPPMADSRLELPRVAAPLCFGVPPLSLCMWILDGVYVFTCTLRCVSKHVGQQACTTVLSLHVQGLSLPPGPHTTRPPTTSYTNDTIATCRHPILQVAEWRSRQPAWAGQLRSPRWPHRRLLSRKRRQCSLGAKRAIDAHRPSSSPWPEVVSLPPLFFRRMRKTQSKDGCARKRDRRAHGRWPMCMTAPSSVRLCMGLPRCRVVGDHVAASGLCCFPPCPRCLSLCSHPFGAPLVVGRGAWAAWFINRACGRHLSIHHRLRAHKHIHRHSLAPTDTNQPASQS
ncbi:hypothetical protein BKA80DRAFT_126527 [Phyllosticta citrichinensis]